MTFPRVNGQSRDKSLTQSKYSRIRLHTRFVQKNANREISSPFLQLPIGSAAAQGKKIC